MAGSTDYDRGDMEIAEQARTFTGIMGLIKWGSLVLACLVMALVLWFCTPTGLIQTGAVVVIMAAAGVFFLSRKPPAH